MDEEIQPAGPEHNAPSKTAYSVTTKKPVGKIMLTIFLVLVLVSAAGVAGFWWRDRSAKVTSKDQAAQIQVLKQEKASLEKQLATEKNKTTTSSGSGSTVCSATAPNATTIDNIKASITSGNTAALEGYMATSLSVVTAGSAAQSGKTPTQAVASITSFITADTTAWNYDFSLPAATLSTYQKGAYKQYFPSIAVVGKAANGKVISFSFDCNGKISAVLMSANDTLLK